MKLSVLLLLTQVQAIKLTHHQKMSEDLNEDMDWINWNNIWKYSADASKWVAEQYNKAMEHI